MRQRPGGPHLMLIAGALATVLTVGCGDSYNGNGSPTGPSGGPGPSGATVTIANGAVSPGEVIISRGQSVTFVNNDGRAREIMSDPHGTHTDCPPMNAVGTLQPNQSRQTNTFTTARTCGFHDHQDPDNPALRGRVIVQ